MIVDNYPAHSDVLALDWVELIFLPPNTMLVTQSMDQGVIRSLKVKYRSLAAKKQIDALETGNQLPKFANLKHYVHAYESMEFHSRRKIRDLFQMRMILWLV